VTSKAMPRIKATKRYMNIIVSIDGLNGEEAESLYHFCRMFGYKAEYVTQGDAGFGKRMHMIANKIQNALYDILPKEKK